MSKYSEIIFLMWKYLKNFIAPVFAYIKGRIDENIKIENEILKAENERLRGRFDRIQNIIVKYNGIRDDVRNRMSEKNNGS